MSSPILTAFLIRATSDLRGANLRDMVLVLYYTELRLTLDLLSTGCPSPSHRNHQICLCFGLGENRNRNLQRSESIYLRSGRARSEMPRQELSFRMFQSVACSPKESQGFAESCARMPGIKHTSTIFPTGETRLGYGNPLPMADDCNRLDYSLALQQGFSGREICNCDI